MTQGLGNRSHIMFIDSHCHINFPELAEQMPDLLARMREEGELFGEQLKSPEAAAAFKAFFAKK